MSKRIHLEPQQHMTQVCAQHQPTRTVRTIAGGLVLVHFSALIVALSANAAPSFLHGKLLMWLAPFHVTTGLDYTMLPMELTQAANLDAPLQVEVLAEGGSQKWQQLPLPQVRYMQGSLLTNRSRWPNLSRLLYWVDDNEPDNEVLPEFAAAALRTADAREAGQPGSVFEGFDSSRLAAIRLFQPHVLSFDEDLIVSQEKADLIADALQGEVVYSAKLVRDAKEGIRLIPQQADSMTAKPVVPPASPTRLEVGQ